MIKSTRKVLSEIRSNGYCTVQGVFSKQFCLDKISKLENILKKLKNKNKYFGSNNNQVIYNYFYHDISLIKLVHNKYIDKIMKNLIDDNYVLISPSARNPRMVSDKKLSKKTSGFGWHVDSKVIEKKSRALIKPSVNFFAIIALEDFTEKNASTEYVIKSHKLYRKPENRKKKFKSKFMRAKAGSIIFFDTALWHQVGKPSKFSRWSIFNMYGPWYMKPYFRFTDGLSSKLIKKLSKKEKKILHFNSIPPKNSNGVLTTLKTL